MHNYNEKEKKNSFFFFLLQMSCVCLSCTWINQKEEETFFFLLYNYHIRILTKLNWTSNKLINWQTDF